MITHQVSSHSVSKVLSDQVRCCVSNYYFSKASPSLTKFFHVTSFRGRPNESIQNLFLRVDALLRMKIRMIFPGGAFKRNHFYDKL